MNSTYLIAAHLLGLMVLFLGFGQLFQTNNSDKKSQKLGSMLHGIGLMILLLSGLALAYLSEISWPLPGWLIGKTIAWFVLGLSLPIIKRKILSQGIGMLFILAVGFAAILIVRLHG